MLAKEYLNQRPDQRTGSKHLHAYYMFCWTSARPKGTHVDITV